VQLICENYLLPADTWPQVFDDSEARKDWGWRHDAGIEELTDIMINALRPVYGKEGAVNAKSN
jgi:nucleoside-diphosphate-sugar epimerase